MYETHIEIITMGYQDAWCRLNDVCMFNES